MSDRTYLCGPDAIEPSTRTAEPRTAAGRRVYAELDDTAWLDDILAIEAEATSAECDAWLAEGYHRAEAAAPAGLDVDGVLEAIAELYGPDAEIHVDSPKELADYFVDIARLLHGQRDDE